MVVYLLGRISGIVVVFVINEAIPAWRHVIVIVAHTLDQRLVDADHANVGTLAKNQRRGETDDGPTIIRSTGLQGR